jgi:tetratricopeptide (TPR) repeat protein
MTDTILPNGRRHWPLWLGGILVLLLAAVGGGIWWWLTKPRDQEPVYDAHNVDWEAVYEAHNHAIAVMDQFKYPEAIVEFEKVVQMAPDWIPARVNLGIALLNASGDDPSKIPLCKAVLEEVLQREPDNPYAHFCLGILLLYNKDGLEAAKHFEAVLQKDPTDAYSWCWLGRLKPPNSDEQTECFHKALKLNRHLSGAIYGLAMNLRRENPERAQELLDEHERLKRIDWGESKPIIKYSLMGT